MVRCMDWLHKIVLLMERPPEGHTWSGERLARKQKTSRPDDVWPHMWKVMSDAAKKKAKTKWAIQKKQGRQCQTIERIFFIEPNDEDFKLTMRAARRKLEVPMPAAVPCKIPIKSSGETHRNIGKRKTKYACVVDADESTRQRVEGAVHKSHQDHITAKGMNSTVLCTSSFRCLGHSKIPDAKAAVEKEW